MSKTHEKVRQIYANAKQIKFLKSRARRKTFLGGRGSGKTTTLGYTSGYAFEELPRAKVTLCGLTYVQLDLIVLPELKNALSRMGYVEYTKASPWGVYVIGIQPPDHWPKPYSSPGKRGWQYCMSFINGFCIQLVSQDRPDSQRGINNDGVWVDESATISPDFVYKIMLPAKRANKLAPFAKSHLHLSFLDFTSAPWTVEGGWMLKTEDAWKAELELRARMSDAEKMATPPENLFLESTWEDNRDVLPDNYYRDLEETLDALTLDVEVWNRRFTQRPDGFYYAFSSNKHCYTSSYSYQYDDKTGLHLHQTNDYREDKKLEVSLDFNAAICWLVICQEIGREFRQVNSLYRKPMPGNEKTSLFIQLADAFDQTYGNAGVKEVDVWGDPSGKAKSAATTDTNKPFLEQFADHLQKKGWRVNRLFRGFVYPSHKNKYLLLNHLLEEGSERLPKLRFNQNTNKPFIIAVQQTRTKDNFEKDKGSEQTARNREYATDGTDAYDYIVWGKYKRLMPSGVKRGFSNSVIVLSK